MAADGRIDTRGDCTPRRLDDVIIDLVERLSHAVETLELEAAVAAGEGLHSGQRVRVVRRELRIDQMRHREKRTRTRQVRHIGSDLAGEDGIVCETEFLAALDLAVPIGALREAHWNDAALSSREIG